MVGKVRDRPCPKAFIRNSMQTMLDDDLNHPLSCAAPVHGAIAQLGERLHGMQEVGGSIPPGSTKLLDCFKDFAPRPHRLEA